MILALAVRTLAETIRICEINQVCATDRFRAIISPNLKRTPNYVLKRSDLNDYFKLAEHVVEPVRETTREKLVQLRTEEASSEPAGDKREEKDDDASALKSRNLMLAESARRKMSR